MNENLYVSTWKSKIKCDVRKRDDQWYSEYKIYEKFQKHTINTIYTLMNINTIYTLMNNFTYVVKVWENR